ncbi:MAG: hypothetical protein K1W26_07645 [Acetatifactor sp.]
MEIFAEDAIIGDFKLSDYGYLLASFGSNSESTEDLGMDHDTVEEYIGRNPTPIFLGSQYSSKLKPTLTIVKNPCVHKLPDFTEHECRDILRRLTGNRGYRRMQILHSSIDEELFYNVRTVSVNYQKVAGKIVGVILNLECDSQFAWTKETDITIPARQDKPFNLYISTDDLSSYVYPVVTVRASSPLASISLRNISDNNWETVIKHLFENEVITIDSRRQIIFSSRKDRMIANDFNMRFPRFIPDKNTYITDQDISIQFKYSLPRKAGFV